MNFNLYVRKLNEVIEKSRLENAYSPYCVSDI